MYQDPAWEAARKTFELNSIKINFFTILNIFFIHIKLISATLSFMKPHSEVEKLPSISHQQKSTHRLQGIISETERKDNEYVMKNWYFLPKKKDLTPRAVINKNQMPRLNKPFPKKANISSEISKFNIKTMNSSVIDQNKADAATFGFSPKIKYRQTKIKTNHLFTEESTQKNTNESEITNAKKIFDLAERVPLPPINLNKSHLGDEWLTPITAPKTKKFVTVSFNQLMLKNLYKNQKTRKLLKNLLLYNYVTLEEMNRKLKI